MSAPAGPGPEAADAGRAGAAPSGPFSFLSRRRFLKVALGAGGLAVAGTGGLLALRGAAPDVAGLKILGAHPYRTLTALAQVVLPRGGAFPDGADDRDLARAFDAFLEGEPEANVTELTRALHLLELGPVIFEGRLATFSRLEPGERLAHWTGWGRSRLLLRRQVSVAFSRFLSMVFYDHPGAWAGIGYPGPSWGPPR